MCKPWEAGCKDEQFCLACGAGKLALAAGGRRRGPCWDARSFAGGLAAGTTHCMRAAAASPCCRRPTPAAAAPAAGFAPQAPGACVACSDYVAGCASCERCTYREGDALWNQQCHSGIRCLGCRKAQGWVPTGDGTARCKLQGW